MNEYRDMKVGTVFRPLVDFGLPLVIRRANLSSFGFKNFIIIWSPLDIKEALLVINSKHICFKPTEYLSFIKFSISISFALSFKFKSFILALRFNLKQAISKIIPGGKFII